MALFLDKGDMMSELDKIDPVFPKINIGGKDREVCYGFKFFSDLIKDHGDISTGLAPFSAMASGKLDPEALYDMVYKGLYHDEEIKPEDVKRWLNREIKSMVQMKDLFEKIMLAINASMKRDDENPPSPIQE